MFREDALFTGWGRRSYLGGLFFSSPFFSNLRQKGPHIFTPPYFSKSGLKQVTID